MRSSGWGDVVSSPCAPATPCIATPLSPSTHSLFFEIPPAHIQLWVATSNGAGGLISDGSSRFGFRGPKYLRSEFWVTVNMILLICGWILLHTECGSWICVSIFYMAYGFWYFNLVEGRFGLYEKGENEFTRF